MPEAVGAKAVVWDFGNVIVRWDPRTLYSKIFPDPVERDRFLADVCTMAWHAAHDRGVTFAENRAPLLEKYPQHEAEILAWETRWPEMFSGAIAETEAAMHDLARAGVPQFGLSNVSMEVIDQVRGLSTAFAHLRDVVASGDVGLAKPDAAIFHLAAERFGYGPQELLFVDDGAHNTAAAAALGWDVHHFTDPAAIRPVLEARGLL
jgi:2-haloacid dehalogenase/putative hydrolase of the HAD superfamily